MLFIQNFIAFPQHLIPGISQFVLFAYITHIEKSLVVLEKEVSVSHIGQGYEGN